MVGMECHCSCHMKGKDGAPITVHCMPCCYTCPTCGKNIPFMWQKAHEEEHIKNGPRPA